MTGKLTPAVGTRPHHTDLSEGWWNGFKIWQWASTRVSDKREQGGICYFYNDLASKHTFGHALQVSQVKFIQWVSGGKMVVGHHRGWLLQTPHNKLGGRKLPAGWNTGAESEGCASKRCRVEGCSEQWCEYAQGNGRCSSATPW